MDERDLGSDPMVALRAWLEEAERVVAQPFAMTVATATADGRPSARVVLLRGIDGTGLSFFTNFGSRKSDELRQNARAAVVLHWWELGRQVRVEGAVEQLPTAESDAYWRTRPRASRVAAWASPQSQPLTATELEALVAATERRFRGEEIARPPFWGGYRVLAETVEFWTHREDRLHDRIRFLRSTGGWRRERLAP